MIENIKEVLVNNLFLSLFGVILFILTWSCNVVAGLFYNIGIKKIEFSLKKLLDSVLKMSAIAYTTLGLVVVITIFPTYIQQIGFAIPQEFIDFFNISIILGAFTTPICIYSKDAFMKLKDILLNYSTKGNSD